MVNINEELVILKLTKCNV